VREEQGKQKKKPSGWVRIVIYADISFNTEIDTIKLVGIGANLGCLSGVVTKSSDASGNVPSYNDYVIKRRR
jgi:hypothetical protein